LFGDNEIPRRRRRRQMGEEEKYQSEGFGNVQVCFELLAAELLVALHHLSRLLALLISV
jgi:hypothetical protein